MKKLIALLLAVIFTVTLVGCGESANDSQKPNDDKASTASTAEINTNFKLEELSFTMDGKQYKMPFTWKEIAPTAESLYNEVPETVDFDETVGYWWKSAGGKGAQVTVELCSPTPGTPTAGEDCLVKDFYIQGVYDEHEKIDFVFPEGITFGDSYEDLLAAYGEPENKVEVGDTGVVSEATFESEDGKLSINVSLKDNKICSVSFEIDD